MEKLLEYENIIRFFVTCATSLLVVVVALGVKFPHGKDFRRYRIAKYLVCSSFFITGAQIFFWSSIIDTSAAVISVMYLIDSLSYLLLLAVPVAVLWGELKERYRKSFVVVSSLLVILLELLFMFSYDLFGLHCRYCLFGAVSAALISLVWLGVSFYMCCSQIKRRGLPVKKWLIVFYYSILLSIIYFQFLLPISGGLHTVSLPATILFTLINVWFVVRMYDFAYQLRLEDSVKGVSQPLPEKTVQDDNMDKDAEMKLAEAIDQWIRDKRFLEQDKGIESVVSDLGTDIRTFRQYFRTRVQIDFRTWRIALRIEYAKECLKGNPDISVNKLSEICGFPTKSNFYHYFKQITGMTPAEYREYLAKNPK